MANKDISVMFGCEIFWAIFLPPIAVILHCGCFNLTVLLNICLTLLGWIPGIIHAFRVILDDGDRLKSKKKTDEEKGEEVSTGQQVQEQSEGVSSSADAKSGEGQLQTQDQSQIKTQEQAQAQTQEQAKVKVSKNEEKPPGKPKRKDPTMKEAAFMLLETGFSTG